MFQLLLFVILITEIQSIFHGTKSLKKTWPWQVSIMIQKRYGGDLKNSLCGGSIINNRWILTAAHCLENKPYGTGVAPASNISAAYGKVIEKLMNYKEVTKVIVYKLNRQGGSQDVALLQMKKEIKFSLYVQPIELMNENKSRKFPYKNCYTSGFGKTETPQNGSVHLRHAKINVLSQCRCDQKMERYKDYTNLKGKMICSFNEDGQKQTSACQGDSGGPLVCKQDGSFVQVGIVNTVLGNCSATFYARVATYYDWIMKKIQ